MIGISENDFNHIYIYIHTHTGAMKALTAQKVVGDLGNVLGTSDLRAEYFQRALMDTENLVSVVYGAGKVVAAVAWTPQKKGLQVIAAAGTKGHATNLVAALEESWRFSLGFFIGVMPCCRIVCSLVEGRCSCSGIFLRR